MRAERSLKHRRQSSAGGDMKLYNYLVEQNRFAPALLFPINRLFYPSPLSLDTLFQARATICSGQIPHVLPDPSAIPDSIFESIADKASCRSFLHPETRLNRISDEYILDGGV